MATSNVLILGFRERNNTKFFDEKIINFIYKPKNSRVTKDI